MLNNNYQNILIKFGLWVATGLVLIIIGISNVFALENDDVITFYDNSGSSVTQKTTAYTQEIKQTYSIFTTAANSYGGLVVIQLNQPLVKGHMYNLFLNVGAESNGGYTTLSSKNCIGAGDRPSDVVNNYINCVITPKYSQRVEVTTDKGRGLYFTFISDRNGAYLAIPYTTQYTCTNCRQYSYGYELTDAGDTTGLNQTQVNNLLNQQTTNITNTINEMETNFINNQNANTDKQIESQKVCNIINKDNIILQNKYLDISGNENRTGDWGITDYININNSNIEFTDFSSNTSTSTCFYTDTKNLISCTKNNNLTTFQIPTNAYYMRMTILTLNNLPRAKICKNGNQALNDSIKEQTNAIDDLHSSLTDSSSIDMGSLGNTAGWLPPGPIDSIINLPLNLFNNLLSALNGTCQPINIPLPYVDKTLPIPCISTIFNQIDGLPGFWNWVGAITSVVILYRYLLALYKYYDDLTTLKANFISDFGGAP